MFRAIRLHHLQKTSWALILAGVATFLAAMAMDQSEVFQLAGLMLALCGAIKLAVVYVWKNLAHMETDGHDPIPPI